MSLRDLSLRKQVCLVPEARSSVEQPGKTWASHIPEEQGQGVRGGKWVTGSRQSHGMRTEREPWPSNEVNKASQEMSR